MNSSSAVADDSSEPHSPEGGGGTQGDAVAESIGGNADLPTVPPAQGQGPPALPPRPANLPVPGILHPPHAFSRTTTTSKNSNSHSYWIIFYNPALVFEYIRVVLRRQKRMHSTLASSIQVTLY